MTRRGRYAAFWIVVCFAQTTNPDQIENGGGPER
jgi:hypothetical protein